MEDFFSILNVDCNGRFEFMSSKKINQVEIKVLSQRHHVIWQGFMDVDPNIIYWIYPDYGDFKYNLFYKIIFSHSKEEEKKIEIPEINFHLLNSLFSNTCSGMQTYRDFNSSYSSPLIGNIFLNDFNYLDFCEGYEKIISGDFSFVEPEENLFWNQISEGNRIGSNDSEKNYPVMNIEGIEIHWIHEKNEGLEEFIKKWDRRIERSKGKDKIFIWSSSEFLNFHGNIERKKIIDRFKSLPNKSIFLTERAEESFEDDNHLVFCVEEWIENNQSQRSDNGTLVWNNQFEISKIFKRIIIRKFYLPKYQSMKFRKIKIEDLHLLNEIRNFYSEDFLHDSRKFSIEETFEWFNRENPDYYMIEMEEEIIGYFRISKYSPENKNIYIGADIHPNFTGKGLGYLSYKKFISYLFEEYNLNKISLEVLSNNYRAIHLYEKIGFIKEGVKREEILKGEIYIDSILMSILRKEWK